MAKPRIGISGWTFPGWRGSFYPEGLAQRRELEFASRALSSIEINGTFYALQKPQSFQNWYKEVPEDFCFSVKAPQFLTHVLRLKECEEPLANFMASGVLCLKQKLGPLLWQFPPFVTLKDDRFEKFLDLLPKDSRSASRLAKKHGKKVKGRAHTEVSEDFPVRHAFEFRHHSFMNENFLSLLREHNVAFVFAHEGGEKAPYTEDPTADFIYARLHGEGEKYAKGYPDSEITKWAKKITSWSKAGLETFVYFSNEAKHHSPTGAIKLMKRLKSR